MATANSNKPIVKAMPVVLGILKRHSLLFVVDSPDSGASVMINQPSLPPAPKEAVMPATANTPLVLTVKDWPMS
jgi:hypothetical protein